MNNLTAVVVTKPYGDDECGITTVNLEHGRMVWICGTCEKCQPFEEPKLLCKKCQAKFVYESIVNDECPNCHCDLYTPFEQ